MRILLTGATGFIGGHLADTLEAAGHSLLCTARDAARARAAQPRRSWVPIDFAAPPRPADWLPWLRGIDVVINAVGIVQERRGQTFENLHERAPQALFTACVEAQVRRVIQISALGADAAARSRYHLSKRVADAALLALPIDAVVLQPSLVFGLDGGSAQIFLQMAALPVIPVPQGAGAVQPVHVDDFAALVVRLVDGATLPGRRIAVVGPRPLAWAENLQALRAAIGLAPAPLLRVPAAWVDIAAAFAGRLPNALLNPQTWQMLRRGNTADPMPFERCLGRAPRDATQFVRPTERRIAVTQARLPTWLALLRWSIALVWIVTGIVSLGPYPVHDSLALLARVGAHGGLASMLLYGAAALDLLLGVATLAWPRRSLWLAQVALIGVYTLLISWRLPGFWLHPYGPV